MEKLIILVNIHWLLFFKRYTWEHLSIEKADNKKSNFAHELRNFDKGMKELERKSSLT